jgi:hypothetical protein
MKKTCVIMQPTYLPWLGYFDLIRTSDVFVFLDHVQFSNQSWQQRNRVRSKEGEIILTLPIKKSGKSDQKINDAFIDLSKKPYRKHLNTLQSCYAKSINFKEIFEEISEIYNKQYEKLVDLNIELISYGCKKFNINTEFVLSSSLLVEVKKVDALIEICKKVDANHYHSPIGSMGYINENNLFAENNIVLTYQNYKHPLYNQISYNDFIQNLSFLDFLFNSKSYKNEFN